MPRLGVHGARRQATGLQHLAQHVFWHWSILIFADSQHRANCIEYVHSLQSLSNDDGHPIPQLVPIAALRREAVAAGFRNERPDDGRLGYGAQRQTDWLL